MMSSVAWDFKLIYFLLVWQPSWLTNIKSQKIAELWGNSDGTKSLGLHAWKHNMWAWTLCQRKGEKKKTIFAKKKNPLYYWALLIL